MLSKKVKFMSLALVGLMGLNAFNYAEQVRRYSHLNAGIIADNEYTGLTSSYFKIEGQVGDTINDFVVDYKGKSTNVYTITTPTNSLSNVGTGLKLTNPGTGEATIKYNGASLKLEYNVKPDPDAVTAEKPEQETKKHKLYKVTANGKPASGVIMYIDDSKNAFKTTGDLYIPENFLDNKTHAIYVAKFTKNGPVAYKVTEFTSLAGEINFMNYGESDVEIKGNNINLKTDLNSLY